MMDEYQKKINELNKEPDEKNYGTVSWLFRGILLRLFQDFRSVTR